MRERYIGLMSGTSADSVDAVVTVFENGQFNGLQGAFQQAYTPELRTSLLALGRSEQAPISLHDYARLDAAVGDTFAEAALGVLRVAGLAGEDVTGIGSHGQTVFHDPRGLGQSLQIGDANRIAARTGVPVVSDFRRGDIALGGEGAPLVPAFHHALFAGAEVRTIANIGGIANVTWLLGADASLVRGFDCGPGNGLMDEWAQRTLGRPYDEDGRLAAAGSVREDWLRAWLAEPYFTAAPPKSTGRAQFNLAWAAKRLNLPLEKFERLPKADVQATFCELSVRSIAAALAPASQKLLVCGGGARNTVLMDRLQALLPTTRVETTATLGLPPEWVEASAFAWLARQRMHSLPGNLPGVTGARGSARLGAIYLS